MTRASLEGLFYPQTVCLRSDALKYMVLLYDRLHFLPLDAELSPRASTITDRWSPNDSMLFAAFGTREDAHRGLLFGAKESAWDDYLKSLKSDYALLEERGVCVTHDDAPGFAAPTQPHPLAAAVSADLRDPKFIALCDKYRNPKYLVPRQPTDTKMKPDGLRMRPPRYRQEAFFAALCSERVNTALYLAATAGLLPVSNHELFTRLLNCKLQTDEPPRLGEARRSHSIPKARFAMLSWTVLAEAVPPDALAARSIGDILRYKIEVGELNQRFRERLFQLESGLQADPWDDGAIDEVQKLVARDVIPEIERLRDEKGRIWERLFGQMLRTGLSRMSAASLIPMLAVHLVPGTSYAQMLSVGTAGVLLAALPHLSSAREEERDLRRNALFFVLGLRS